MKPLVITAQFTQVIPTRLLTLLIATAVLQVLIPLWLSLANINMQEIVTADVILLIPTRVLAVSIAATTLQVLKPLACSHADRVAFLTCRKT